MEQNRCRIAILPYEEDADMKITCLKATYSSQFATLSHRDLLGALLNLGLERETLGIYWSRIMQFIYLLIQK